MNTEQAYEKKTSPKWPYDLGRKKNFEQVSVEFDLVSSFVLVKFFRFFLSPSCSNLLF